LEKDFNLGIIGNKDMVELFGTEANKRYYAKFKKVPKNMIKTLISNAKKEYYIAEYLGDGKYKVENKSDTIISINKRFADYPFIVYDKEYDNLNGVYSIIYDNYIYIGSTIRGFRKRHSDYSCNLKNNNKNNKCLGDKLIEMGGKIDILWSTENNDEFEIRHKEFEFIEKFEKEGLYEVVNKTKMVSVQGRTDRKVKTSNIRKITIQSTDYEKVISFLKENNIKFV
jgi:hypothetical protein